MNRPSASGAQPPDGDPWAAFGYLVAGVVFYGLLGWGLSVWLHAGYWIPIGLLVGLGLGMYMVFTRYRFRAPDLDGESTPPAEAAPSEPTQTDSAQTDSPQRPDSDDRGDTA